MPEIQESQASIEPSQMANSIAIQNEHEYYSEYLRSYSESYESGRTAAEHLVNSQTYENPQKLLNLENPYIQNQATASTPNIQDPFHEHDQNSPYQSYQFQYPPEDLEIKFLGENQPNSDKIPAQISRAQYENENNYANIKNEYNENPLVQEKNIYEKVQNIDVEYQESYLSGKPIEHLNNIVKVQNENPPTTDEYTYAKNFPEYSSIIQNQYSETEDEYLDGMDNSAEFVNTKQNEYATRRTIVTDDEQTVPSNIEDFFRFLEIQQESAGGEVNTDLIGDSDDELDIDDVDVVTIGKNNANEVTNETNSVMLEELSSEGLKDSKKETFNAASIEEVDNPDRDDLKLFNLDQLDAEENVTEDKREEFEIPKIDTETEDFSLQGEIWLL